MRLPIVCLLTTFTLNACGPAGGTLPELPANIPPAPKSRVAYDTTSAAPCSYEEPLLNKYCGIGVKRNGPGSADVYVTQPQGGTRKLTLRNGKWDTRGTIEAVKLSDGTSLTVGGNEFYQISERVVLGN